MYKRERNVGVGFKSTNVSQPLQKRVAVSVACRDPDILADVGDHCWSGEAGLVLLWH